MAHQLKYIDLFAGCGGLSLGLHNAGLEGLFAVEKNSDAFSTLQYNLINTLTHFDWPEWVDERNWDIDELLNAKAEELRELRGQVDVIVGGPPCQGFSIAGQRQASDKRNKLIHSYLKFVEIIQPDIVMFENVRGFTMKFKNSGEDNNTPYSEIVLKKLNDLGYTDAHGEIIDFSDYGVPQRRKRFIVIATRQNISRQIFAMIENNKQSFLTSKNISTTNNCEAALSDLEQSHGLTTCSDSPKFKAGIVFPSPSQFQKYLRLDNKRKYVPDSHRYVNHRTATKKVFQALLENAPRDIVISGDARKAYGIKKRSVRVLDPNKPAPTLTTIPDDCIHYSEPRVMTVREYARLQTFPDWFEFKGAYTTGGKRRIHQVPRYTQIGNAVPPLFAEQLGVAIKKVLFEE